MKLKRITYLIVNEIEDSQSDERSSILLVELQGSAQAVMLHCV